MISWDEAADKGYIECILDGNRGIYLPQDFTRKYDLDDCGPDIDPEDWAIVENGPDEEFYWEAWDNILENARILADGHFWGLWQDQDLFAIRADADLDPDSY